MKPITGAPQPEETNGEPAQESPSGDPFESLRRTLSDRMPKSPGLSRKLTVPVVVLLSVIFGWLVATRILLPAPELPSDLAEVPDLAGMDSTSAVSVLADAGLRMGKIDLVGHSSIEEGRVFGQSPLPGQLAQDGGEVHVTISTGAELVSVPDVRGGSVEEATEILAAAGFGVSVEDVESNRPGGEVIGMEPEAGEQVRLPLEVSLSVSLGPAQVTMPNLVRLTEEEAEQVLDSLGLELIAVEERFRFGQDQGRVLEQNPEAGARVDVGSGVRLVIGRRRR